MPTACSPRRRRTPIFSGDFAGARVYFDALAAEGERAVTVQDRTVYALCRPERLLDLIRRFTVFDGGVRKVARHQQFFGIRHAVETVKQHDVSGARKGGVIWHTQGSGKSLTMVMLGRSLALERSIENPRIIIVTDRDDLDKQIKDTFKSCDLEPVRATSGSHLLELVHNKAPLVTTIINKFDTALRNSKLADDDPNIFVLVDESHRTQTGRYGGHSQFAAKMRRLLPKACYLGFTGTPLLKKEKNTLSTFGRLIHRYAIDEAVADGAVVPLLYEGRLVEQQVSGTVIDRWFEKISEGLTEDQKRDLKRKFSRMDALAKTDQAIRAKAFDISEHYRQYWQGTGFKAQLVAPSKAAAVRFKEVLDEIGHVSSADCHLASGRERRQRGGRPGIQGPGAPLLVADDGAVQDRGGVQPPDHRSLQRLWRSRDPDRRLQAPHRLRRAPEHGALRLQVPEGTQSPSGDCAGEPALRARRNGEAVRLHRRLRGAARRAGQRPDDVQRL